MSARAQPTLLVFTLGAAGDCARRPALPARLREAEVELRRSWLAVALDRAFALAAGGPVVAAGSAVVSAGEVSAWTRFQHRRPGPLTGPCRGSS